MVIERITANQLWQEMVEKLHGDSKKMLGMLSGFAKGGDWAFVIKAHALIEGLVMEMIVCQLGQPSLAPLFTRLPMVDGQYGKLEFAKALGLLTPDERMFIRWLGKLRNCLAHQVENAEFSFKEHLAKCDSPSKKQFIDSITYFLAEDHDEQTSRAWRQCAETNTPTCLLMALLMLGMQCSLRCGNTDLMRKVKDASEKATTEALQTYKALLVKRKKKPLTKSRKRAVQSPSGDS